MKAQTSYLDLEERNGLVYEIGLPNPFTGLVRVPFLDFTGKLEFFCSQNDYDYGSAKTEGKEFLSACLSTYENEADYCDVDSILDIKASRGAEECLRNFVCEFRYKSGLKHGISRELILLSSGWGDGYWEIIEETFIGGKCEQIALYYLYNEKLAARGSCNENFMVGFDTTYNFPDEVKEGLWEEYYSTGNLKSRGTFVNGKRDGLFKDFHQHGQPRFKGKFKKGKLEGLSEYYDEAGKLTKTKWKNDKQEGLSEYYDKDGNLKKIEPF